jgi:hypothetical protein
MTDITDRDRRLVDQYLGHYLHFMAYAGPNSAVADNMRRAAETVVAEQRERCATEIEWLRRLLKWCRPRLKHPSYQTGLDHYLAAGPSPTPENEPPIVRSEVAEAEPHG